MPCSAVLLLADGGLFAQSFQLSPAAAAPGAWIDIRFSLNSPGDNQPSTLQWQTTVPYKQLTSLQENEIGAAAKAAGKSLTCALKRKTADTYTSVCLLYGGQERIANGVVAALRLQISPEAQPGSFQIRVGEAIAVRPDAKRIPMPPAEAVVTIRTR